MRWVCVVHWVCVVCALGCALDVRCALCVCCVCARVRVVCARHSQCRHAVYAAWPCTPFTSLQPACSLGPAPPPAPAAITLFEVFLHILESQLAEQVGGPPLVFFFNTSPRGHLGALWMGRPSCRLLTPRLRTH